MNMDSRIRVKTEQKYKQLYNDLHGKAVVENHDLFFVCACLGYRQGASRPLQRPDDRFWSGTITTEEWCCYYAMMLEQKDMDFEAIMNDQSVISAIEQYANAGIEILVKDALNGIVRESKGLLIVDAHEEKELPRTLLSYLYDQGICAVSGKK